jgi:adenylate cyclase
MRRSRSLPLLVAAFALALVAGLLARGGDWLGSLERSSIDTRFSIGHPQVGAAKDIVIVAVDHRTSERFQSPRIPRRYQAQMIDLLHKGGAAVIAYDLEFVGPTNDRDDRALLDALQRNPGVILAAVRVNDQGDFETLGGLENVSAVGAHVGDAQIALDAEGEWRWLEYRPRTLPTIAEAAASAYRHHDVDPKPFLEHGDRVPIAYQGPPGTFERISYTDLLSGRVPPSAVRGKIAIVGQTDPALGDVHQAPLGAADLMPGPEIQANAIATVLGGEPLQPASGFVDVLLIVILAAIAPLGALLLRPWGVVAVSALAVALFLVAAALAFKGGTIVAVTYPLVALVVGTAGAIAVLFAGEARERARQRALFGRFVPRQVVDSAIDDERSSDLRDAVVPLDATVMFSDLRGFTRFSETRSPDIVVRVLNRYLGDMSDAISAHGGTVVDYMGDGIMAVFGAPVPQADHADRALAAAREMLGSCLPRFNAWVTAEGHGEPFRMGIGLNSGPVVSTNVGSKNRVAYTAIGDTTNTASRIESMTKETPHSLLVAQATVDRLGVRPADLVFVDEIDVRGRDEPARLWSIGEAAAAAEPVT